MALLCATAKAQDNTTKVLHVGDTLPLITITNVANHPHQTIKVDSLRGKPLIIDFWGQYCTPCIKTIGKLDSLRTATNHAFEVITVSDHNTEPELLQTLQRYPITQHLKLPVILGSKALKTWFPHKIISHLVWIGADGVIKAITDGEAVTPAHLQSFINNEPLNWPVKQDELNFNLRTPLLQYTSSFNNAPQQLYYSAFFSYLENINAVSWYPVKDSTSGTQTLSIFNEPLLNYCGYATGTGNLSATGHYILKVKDSSRYLRPAGTDARVWSTTNTFCYTIRLPIGITAKKRNEIIAADISNWLLRMGITTQKMPGNTPVIITEL